MTADEIKPLQDSIQAKIETAQAELDTLDPNSEEAQVKNQRLMLDYKLRGLYADLRALDNHITQQF